MVRIFFSGALGILLVLSGGCTGPQVKFSPVRNRVPYRTIYLTAAADPLELNPLIQKSLEQEGYAVLPESGGPGEGFSLSYAYSTGPDLDDEGRVSRRLEWFRVRVSDRIGGDEVATAEVRSGLLDQSPEQEVAALLSALAARLQHPRKPLPAMEKKSAPVPESAPTPEEPFASAGRTEPAPPGASSPDQAEGEPAAEPPASREEEEPVNPWVPRLQSWGLEEWGMEK